MWLCTLHQYCTHTPPLSDPFSRAIRLILLVHLNYITIFIPKHKFWTSFNIWNRPKVYWKSVIFKGVHYQDSSYVSKCMFTCFDCEEVGIITETIKSLAKENGDEIIIRFKSWHHKLVLSISYRSGEIFQPPRSNSLGLINNISSWKFLKPLIT